MVELVCSGGRGEVKRCVEGVEERWERGRREGGRVRERREERVNLTRVLRSKKKETEEKGLEW